MRSLSRRLARLTAAVPELHPGAGPVCGCRPVPTAEALAGPVDDAAAKKIWATIVARMDPADVPAPCPACGRINPEPIIQAGTDAELRRLRAALGGRRD